MIQRSGQSFFVFVISVIVSWPLARPEPPEHPMSGGETTIIIPPAQMSDRDIFGRPAANLSLTRRGDFFAGNSFFQNAWVTAPASTTARDGLGPLFNTMSCQSCHIKDGRGRPPKSDGEEMLSMLVRISVPPDDQNPWQQERGIAPEPVYGDQFQNHGVAGIQPEARVRIKWHEQPGEFADGRPYSLRRPEYVIEGAAYGNVAADIRMSGRVAPAMMGVGLLDAIPVDTLQSLADPQDSDADGISGRMNQVWHATQKRLVPGRFGWKGEQPDVLQQVAAAFAGDIGVTSSIFPQDQLSKHQRQLIDVPNGGSPEVSDDILRLVTFYCKTIAVPARRGHDSPIVLEGEQLFQSAGCHRCHVETLQTGTDADFPELSQQEIHPYTDLLLHDMGAGLADNRPVFEAQGSEWRTPPLWGIGLVFGVNRHTNFLHDGRARNLDEAILWHGGEAEFSREYYRNLPQVERRKLLAFLKSL